MQPETVRALLDLNLDFYTASGESFALTRRRMQPGVLRLLQSIAPAARWLDLGCGSGALGAECARRGQTLYLGLDSSPALLAEARRTAPDISYLLADLSDPAWAQEPAVRRAAPFEVVSAFAVLHHIPSHQLRVQVLNALRPLLAPGGVFHFSVWQFQHSPRLMGRVQPWERAGLDPASLEEGDTLLDWRSPPQGAAALRYVHLFSRPELARLAEECAFTLLGEFESDGEGGRLGLYQAWTPSP